MPQEPLEALIERMKADSAFRAELMEKESIDERLELIFSEILCASLIEMHQAERDLVEEGIEMSTERHLYSSFVSPSLKGSSPQASGYAKPSKAIEKRFKD